MRLLAQIIATASLIVLAHSSATAQEGCRASKFSCSQMNADCESKCRKAGNNPAGCIARLCTAALPTCKANGVWRAGSSPACWTTTNRN